MTPRLRAYAPGDRAEVFGVFLRAVREGAAAFYDADQRHAWAPRDAPDPDRPDKLLQQTCVVACDPSDDRIIGFMSLEDHGHVDMAFVLPEVMGTGVAEALYDAIMQAARARGLTRLTVDASHLARRFFTRRGWRVDAVQQHPHNGQVFERFAMSHDLPQVPS